MGFGMTAAGDLLSAIDAFVQSQKRIHGADRRYEWRPGYSQHEVVASFPLEFGGEMPKAARLEIVGFPRTTELKFRIALCYSAAICRLDYTDETHPNTHRKTEDKIPPHVTGPHFHSWALNRRFFKGASTPPKLHNAEPFTLEARFDSILRWFCDMAHIDQLPGGHLIELPRRDSLL